MTLLIARIIWTLFFVFGIALAVVGIRYVWTNKIDPWGPFKKIKETIPVVEEPALPRLVLTVTPSYLPEGISYADGQKVGDIVWSKNFIPLKVDIETADRPVRNLQVLIELDGAMTQIIHITQLSSIDGVSAFPTGSLGFNTDVVVGPTMVIHGVDANGKKFSEISEIGKTNVIAPVWEVQSQNVLPHNKIHLLIAAVRFGPPGILTPDKIARFSARVRFEVTTAKGTVESVNVEQSYDLINRHRLK